MVDVRCGGWHAPGHRDSLGESSGAHETATVARTNDVLAAVGLIDASGVMQGLKDTLSIILRDALRSDPGGGHRTARHTPLGTDRTRQRLAAPDGVDVFPSDDAVLRRVGAILAEQHDALQTSDGLHLTMNCMTVLDLKQHITLDLEAT